MKAEEKLKPPPGAREGAARLCRYCGQETQGPGCCANSLKAELSRLGSLRQGLREAFSRRATPRLQHELLKNSEEIRDVRDAIAQFDDASEPSEPLGRSNYA